MPPIRSSGPCPASERRRRVVRALNQVSTMMPSVYTDIRRIIEDQDALNDRNVQLRYRNNRQAEIINDLTDRMATLQEDLVQAREKVDELEAENARSGSLVFELTQRVRARLRLISDLNSTCSQLMNERDQLIAERESLSLQRESLATERDSLNVALDWHQKEIKRLVSVPKSTLDKTFSVCFRRRYDEVLREARQEICHYRRPRSNSF